MKNDFKVPPTHTLQQCQFFLFSLFFQLFMNESQRGTKVAGQWAKQLNLRALAVICSCLCYSFPFISLVWHTDRMSFVPGKRTHSPLALSFIKDMSASFFRRPFRLLLLLLLLLVSSLINCPRFIVQPTRCLLWSILWLV